MRETDSASEGRQWRLVRLAKAIVGVLFAVVAGVVAIYGDPTDRLVYLATFGTFALLAGVMFDAPTVTKLVRAVVSGLPWVASAKEDAPD